MSSSAPRERDFSDGIYRTGREYERTSKEFMRRLVPAEPKLRVLDIGSGTGLNAEALREMGHEVCCVDISSVAVEKLTAQGFEAIEADVLQGVPYASNTFDFVYASDVIEHLSDTGVFLTEVWRVLRPSGHVLLSTPNSAFWAFRLLALVGQTATEMQHPWHLRFFSKRSLASALATVGFEDIAISGRHMYAVIPDAASRYFGPLFKWLGLEREYRLTTGNHFWHLSRFARRASPFWADSFIVSARKPG